MNLKQQALGGVKWTMTASLVNILLQLIQLAILARILSPEDFGLMAIVMVVIGFSQLFIDMGVSNSIIYKQGITEKELSSLYWLNIFIGIVFFLTIILLSPTISVFYQNIKLNNLINLVAVSFLIKPIGQQFMVLLHKEMLFKATSIIEVIGKVISFIIVISMAHQGYGVYSLAVGTLVYTTGTTFGYNLYGRKLYKPRLYFKVKEIKEYINFGLFQMGDKFLNYFASQMDTILIGRILGMETLGIYNIAKDLTSKPYAIFNPIITKVTFPMMSKISDNILKLKSIFLKTLNYLAYINISVYLLIFILAEPIILILFGANWLTAIPIIQILAFTFIFRAFGNPSGSLLLSRGRASNAFYWNLTIFILYPIFLFLGSYWELKGVAIAALILQMTLFIPNWRINVYPFTEIKLNEYLKAFKKPFIFAIIPLPIIYLVTTMIIGNNILTVLASLIIYASFFLILVHKFEKQLFLDGIELLPKGVVKYLNIFKILRIK